MNSIRIRAKRGEEGFVAILTVMFFILLVSVITISFLRVITNEQEQVIEDDLTKGALAAAESGVEDAKRALTYCRGLSGAAQTSCYAKLSTTTCPGIFAPTPAPDLAATLGLVRDTNNAVQIGDAALNQRTTCTQINLATADAVGEASDGLASVTPLNGASTFNTLRIEWHDAVEDGTLNAPATGTVDTENLRLGNWQSGGNPYPAMMRVQLFYFTPGNTLAQISNQNATVFFVPTSGGASPSVTLAALDPASNIQRQLVNCSAGPQYACAVNLRFPSINPAGATRYFVKLSSIYGTPHYRLSLANGVSPVNFFDAQPSIDVTGAAGDVFRRVISRVSYSSTGFFTNNVIDSGTSVCKDFLITLNGATSAGCPIP